MSERRANLLQELVKDAKMCVGATSSHNGDTALNETRGSESLRNPPSDLHAYDHILRPDNDSSEHMSRMDLNDSSAINETSRTTARSAFPGEMLQSGHLASSDQSFCSLYKLLNFSYLRAIKKQLPEGLRRDFIDKDILWNRHWHFYYVWPSNGAEAIILLPEYQFRDFLQDISPWFPDVDVFSYWTYIKYRDIELLIDFPDHPRFTPRYLGETYSRKDFTILVQRVPSRDFRAINEQVEPPMNYDDIETFSAITQGQAKLQLEISGKDTVDILLKSQLQRKADQIAEKKRHKKEKQAAKRHAGAEMFKRTQHYLGMRPNTTDPSTMLPRLDPDQSISHPDVDPVVLICFDVESWERDHNTITEIGLAIFSTTDLAADKHPIPGVTARNWHPLIQAHHFRIIEHSHHINSHFVQGNPFGFSFGTSQDISIEVAGLLLEDMLDSLSSSTQPATTTDTSSAGQTQTPKIVLVGHAVAGDVRYIEKLGFNIAQHHAVIDTIDTQVLWQALNGGSPESHSAGLSKVLMELGLEYGGLHNAGNDAVYSMRALLAMMVLEGSLRSEVS